jgi:glycosyltransferase involved in cell wall biosynthesis
MTSPRLMYILTIPQSALWYLKGQLGYMQSRGYQTTFVSAPGDNAELALVGRQEGVDVWPLEVSREIDPVRDLISMWRLARLMRQIRPDIVNFGNPKTGLVGGLVSWFLGVPVRIYTLHGLRLETVTGVKRRILMFTERLTMACAHQVVAVSPSLRDQTLAFGLVAPAKLRVLNQGSVNGIPVLTPDPLEVAQLRAQLGLGQTAVVYGFVGRFTRDKGIRELVLAFRQLQTVLPMAVLLLVGEFEDGDPVDSETRDAIMAERSIGKGIIWAGYAADVTPYYALMDVLVLPTYREGFPTVALEGASLGLPLITTDATGARDAVQDGITGVQVPVGDETALARAMADLGLDPERRRQFGAAARARVMRDFSQDAVWQAWDHLYRTLLSEQRPPRRHHRNVLFRLALLAFGGLLVMRRLVGVSRSTRSQQGKG